MNASAEERTYTLTTYFPGQPPAETATLLIRPSGIPVLTECWRPWDQPAAPLTEYGRRTLSREEAADTLLEFRRALRTPVDAVSDFPVEHFLTVTRTIVRTRHNRATAR